jgi:hypothetical protein
MSEKDSPSRGVQRVLRGGSGLIIAYLAFHPPRGVLLILIRFTRLPPPHLASVTRKHTGVTLP